MLGHQDWIRFGIRSRIIRIFCDYDTCTPTDFEIDFFGFRYCGNLACFIDWFVYFFGAYEKQELFLLRDLLTDNHESVFIDVGANVGQHSLFMSKYCRYVYSFEPFEPVVNKLREKVDVNHIQNVLVHDVGLGEKDEYLDFYAPQGANSGSGSFMPSHATENNKIMGKLRLVNGDEYLNALGLERVDLIKIDVEGFERNVLTGLKNSILKYRPIIFMEFYEDAKSGFSEEQDLMALLPERYRILSVITNRPFAIFFCVNGYQFIKFEFDQASGNILIFPEEILNRLPKPYLRV